MKKTNDFPKQTHLRLNPVWSRQRCMILNVVTQKTVICVEYCIILKRGCGNFVCIRSSIRWLGRSVSISPLNVWRAHFSFESNPVKMTNLIKRMTKIWRLCLTIGMNGSGQEYLKGQVSKNWTRVGVRWVNKETE